MSVVFDRPYQFVPPVRNTAWPWLIQRLRLYDRYLRKKEGVVDYELRNLHHVQSSLDAGHSILLAPNHCRYADPLVLGWPARALGIHVHAMASWHLFNEGWFDAFAIRRMGAFSIYREGNDRQSLETAIDILAEGRRPLIIFPEGTTNRTNDQLKPLLDGVAFIARTAAKRRAKMHQADSTDTSSPAGQPPSGQVVIHPVAIKYLSVHKIDDWATRQLDQFEKQLGWTHMPPRDLRQRTVQLAEAHLALKETQYYGHSNGGDLPERRDALIQHLLETTERRMGLDNESESVRERVRQIRSAAASRFFDRSPAQVSAHESEEELRRDVDAADLAQELFSYPDSYLIPDQVTDMRIVETIQRMQESINGKADTSIPLKAVIEFAPALPVDGKRPRKGEPDPLMQSLESQLSEMLGRLSKEARPL
ncbi:1-acyl-sn-glycerol-3-phosphate acyltransferase [Roseiconus nitratireducens]|uniref:1-acyl-sn-glycerol-3-phosphate acyltransferase n=1 Tax=Roseiconus nitratireducens TaxID=2605748 RepID=A0A5M6DD87_9BACT|nr:lysophospholipid acyltransferase family protein [Roseiconus nitratireducens]KAA5544370.1 1-acyl-sn-glycerol-3-phosphate acyltransferase [Roseiconus nitratireducens]